MQIKCGLVLLMVFLVITGSDIYAQCASVQEDFRQLRKHTDKPPKQLINQATELQKRWLTCRQPVDSAFIRLLFYTGDLFREEEKYVDAARQYDQAVRLASSTKSMNRLLAQARYLLGSAYLYDNRAKLAETSFLLVINHVKHQPEDKQWGILARVNLAYLSSSQGDYEQALAHVEAGQEWVFSLKNNALMAQLLSEKAFALFLLGRYDEAAINAYQTIKLLTEAHETDLGKHYRLLGDIENRRGEIKLAVTAYQTALTYCRSARDFTQQAVVLTNLSFLHYTQQNYPQSLRYAQQALQLQKNSFSRAILFDLVASCYWKTAQFDRALPLYQQGLRAMPFGFNQTNPVQNPSADVMRLVARKSVLLTLMQDKADTWLDYAKATGNHQQRLQYALDTYQVADQMIDYMRWGHTGQQSKLFWRNKTRGMYEHAIETCYRLGDTEQAFRFMEKSRAVMLADQLNELGARQQLSAIQTAEEQRLRQVVGEQQTKLAGIKPDSSVYAAMRTALLTKQDSLDTFLKQLELSNPTYYRYKYDNKTPLLADLQRYLKKQQASFVTYFVGDSALYVLGVTDGKATLKQQSVGNYTRTARQFMTLLNNPNDMTRTATVARFLTLGNELYRQLLAPLNIPAGRVIVSPDGSFIPLETLSRSATQPDYLVKDYAFSYEYSARLLLRKGTAPTQMAGAGFVTGDFLGVAPVAFAPALGQATLAGSDDALKPIAARFGSSALFTHGAATRRAFQNNVSAYRVIHLFTHATADSTGQEPTLYFADSTLRLSDLGDGALPNAQLVVLAACKTGIGAIQRGEGVFSLARGFSALGVPSVLTTLWSVQSDATYRLTDSFYNYLDQGLSKDVALQQAKQDWLATAEGASQLPNYWAGLILIGDTKPLDRPARWPLIAGATLLMLGAGGAGLWWRRRHRAKPAVSSLRPA